jgi:hypothetical protein
LIRHGRTPRLQLYDSSAIAAALLCFCATAARAAEPDAGVSEADIARALGADQAAQAKAAGQSPAAAAPLPSATPAPAPSARGFQTLNPDISAILDFAAGLYTNEHVVKSGDDPQSSGFKVQEVEIALQQVVDPYFRADIFLTIPDLNGLEVEEAYLTATSLPGNFQLRAGIFRAQLGRQNAQHLHMQDFTRRPTINPELMGIDGLRAPGAELSWLTPRIPFYLVWEASVFSVAPADPDEPLQTFGGGGRGDLTYLATARAFFPLGEATSVYAGLNYARGRTSQTSSGNPMIVPPIPIGATPYDDFADNLYGVDLYLKWKPPNQAQTYASFAWQSEYFVRQIQGLVIGGVNTPQLEGGLYTQVVMQTHRRWYAGLRGEVMGIPSGDNIKRQYAGEASLTWGLSEFSRVRLYGELRRGPLFLPLDPTPSGPRTTGAAFLQLEAAIGAHGAHPF